VIVISILRLAGVEVKDLWLQDLERRIPFNRSIEPIDSQRA